MLSLIMTLYPACPEHRRRESRPPFFGFVGKVPTWSERAASVSQILSLDRPFSVLPGRFRPGRKGPLPAFAARPPAFPSPPAPALSGSLATGHWSLVTTVFSTTYELPILQPLCFDIHASHGGYPPPFDVQMFQPLNVQRSISFLLTLFRTLLHFRKTQLVSFQAIPNSFAKTPGGVGALLPPRAPSCSEWVGGPKKSRAAESRNPGSVKSVSSRLLLPLTRPFSG
jgi:hypothetical protein